jgi:hypothetical protein
MLDRTKLSKQLEAAVRHSFDSAFQEVAIATTLWNKIVQDSLFLERAAAAQPSLSLPNWQGPLDNVVNLNSTVRSDGQLAELTGAEGYECPDAYTVVSVDGSQIYPDRHRGTDCFLINVSEIILHYGANRSGAKLESFPYVYTSEDEFSSEEFVSCKRQELEFYHGLELAKSVKAKANNPVVLLFDGSLIFWHLQSKDDQIKKHFFSKYISILQQCAEQNIIVASYISLPKSKDLVSLMRFDVGDKTLFEFLTDADIAQFYLQEWQRSTLFVSNAQITKDYPAQLRPHFFYLNTGFEIARVELPDYIAQDQELLKIVQSVMVDQVQKGNGYPVALSEAHEQAVVKNHERELFYSLINNLNQSKGNLKLSNKLFSKHHPAI